jgi:hypothetical protein
MALIEQTGKVLWGVKLHGRFVAEGDRVVVKHRGSVKGEPESCEVIEAGETLPGAVRVRNTEGRVRILTEKNTEEIEVRPRKKRSQEKRNLL